jgi:hypothetical protein
MSDYIIWWFKFYLYWRKLWQFNNRLWRDMAQTLLGANILTINWLLNQIVLHKEIFKLRNTNWKSQIEDKKFARFFFLFFQIAGMFLFPNSVSNSFELRARDTFNKLGHATNFTKIELGLIQRIWANPIQYYTYITGYYCFCVMNV